MSPGLARALVAFLVVLSAALSFGALERPLANPDEGRYSEISREMAATGDWVTPRLNGLKYFEKPPLQYWASAAAFRIFGEGERPARLYGALCAIATVLLAAHAAFRLWGPAASVATAAALLASPYFVAFAGIVTLDMGLTLWTTLTACAFMLSESSRHDARARRRWMVAAWVGMALAVLSKGLVGIVFPAGALAIYMLLRRDASPLTRLQWGWGIAAFVVIAVPWFAAVSARNPEFPRFFFIHEHFTRFTTTEHRRTEPAWYFVPIVVGGFLPWMLALPAAVAHAWSAERDAGPGIPAPLTFALAWSGFILAFFSASGSKLPAYVLPIFPMLALVLGRYLAEAPAKRLALWLLPMPLVAVALGVLAAQAPERAKDAWSAMLYGEAAPWAIAAAAALLAGTLAAGIAMRLGRRFASLCLVAVGSVAAVALVQQAYERLSPRQSGRDVALKMAPLIGRETRLYSVGIYDQTVPFYIGRTLTLVDYVDEFELGQREEPGRAIARAEDFAAQWQRPGDALAIMQPGHFESFRARGLPMQVVHEDPRRVLVRKP